MESPGNHPRQQPRLARY